jgi:hypothetical protein
MVEQQPSKLNTRVRFPSPAPVKFILISQLVRRPFGEFFGIYVALSYNSRTNPDFLREPRLSAPRRTADPLIARPSEAHLASVFFSYSHELAVELATNEEVEPSGLTRSLRRLRLGLLRWRGCSSPR